MIFPTKFRRYPLAIVVWWGLMGCGKENDPLPTHPVKGQLTLEGHPVAGAEIWLVPQDSNEAVKNAKRTIRPYAKTQADGTFTITSYYTDDGAPAGDYAIMVLGPGSSDNADEHDDTPPVKGKGRRPRAIPTKYGSPTTSGLSFTVQNGPNELNIDLKAK